MSRSEDRRHNRFYNFLLRNTSAAHQREDLYPLPLQMLYLWQIYIDNINPFIKLLHVPTMAKIIREIKGKYHSLDRSMQALVLAISLAAVMSLEDEEVGIPGIRFDMLLWLISSVKDSGQLQC